jgi:hypothetical protein
MESVQTQPVYVLSGLARSVFDERIERGNQSHVGHVPRSRVEEFLGADEIRQTTCSADSNIESVSREEKILAAGDVVSGRCGHAEENYGRFLALEHVDGADFDSSSIWVRIQPVSE